jgi:hypothetical protein
VTTTHRFSESLARSHSYADAPWWQEIYLKAFPGSIMQDMRADGWWQRAGIDRRLHCPNGTTVTVDEKVREENYNDFALEWWSHWHPTEPERRKPGWMEKPDIACDYIAYAFVPTCRCYLLPYRELKRLWEANKNEWWWLAAHRQDGYQFSDAKNPGYVTRSVCVPIPVVLNGIRDALLFTWGDG